MYHTKYSQDRVGITKSRSEDRNHYGQSFLDPSTRLLFDTFWWNAGQKAQKRTKTRGEGGRRSTRHFSLSIVWGRSWSEAGKERERELLISPPRGSSEASSLIVGVTCEIRSERKRSKRRRGKETASERSTCSKWPSVRCFLKTNSVPNSFRNFFNKYRYNKYDTI